MGKRSDFERRERDCYDTPESAIAPLLPHLPKGSTFIECCAGKGNIVDYLEAQGIECIDAFDIVPRRSDIKEMDIFDYGLNNFMAASHIITNPPWLRTKASGYLMHRIIELCSSVRPTWILCDSDWAFTKQAQPYLDYCHKIVNIGRVKWIEDSKYSAKGNSCWYLFDQHEKRESAGPVFYGQ